MKASFISPRNVALLVAAGILASTGTAVAADTSTATSAPVNTLSASRLAHIQYQKNMTTYIAAKQNINNTFRAAVGAANDSLVAAIANVKTAAERKTLTDAHKATVASAKAVRDAALAALTKPTEPVKPTK